MQDKKDKKKKKGKHRKKSHRDDKEVCLVLLLRLATYANLFVLRIYNLIDLVRQSFIIMLIAWLKPPM